MPAPLPGQASTTAVEPGSPSPTAAMDHPMPCGTEGPALDSCWDLLVAANGHSELQTTN